MEIKRHKIDGICVISISGSVDGLTAPDLTDYITTLIDEGDIYLVIDLGHVDFMSSAGLRTILAGLKGSRELIGDLRLASPQPGVEKIFRISGFTDILNIYPDVEEAVNSYLIK